jgi:hypothetical protein
MAETLEARVSNIEGRLDTLLETIAGTLHTMNERTGDLQKNMNERMNDLRQSMNTGFVVLGAISAAQLAGIVTLVVVLLQK